MSSYHVKRSSAMSHLRRSRLIKVGYTLLSLAVVSTVTYGLANLHNERRVASAASLCSPSSSVSVTSDNTYNAYFTRSGGGWTGADGGVSALLPDGRVYWSFSDTWLGTAQGTYPNRTRVPANTPFVRNSAMVQSGAGGIFTTLIGGTSAKPTSLVPDGTGTWYWTNQPIVEGNVLRVPAYQMKNQGSGLFSFATTGVQGIANFSLPSLKFVSFTPLFTSTSIPVYGQALVQSGGYDYLYTSDSSGLSSYAHVARVPVGQLTNAHAWQFYDGGTNWSSVGTVGSARIANMNPMTVVQRGNGYVMLGIPAFSSQLMASYACSPTGPWSTPISIYTIPEVKGTEIAYGVAAHPELDTPDGHLLVTYDINNTGPNDTARVDDYRPRAIRLSLTPGPNTISDLTVASITTFPAHPLPGQPVTFSATVKNLGAGTTPAFADIGVNFYIDGQKVAATTNHLTPLAAGASATYAANSSPSTWTATAGQHTLSATVDESKVIYQTRTNDTAAVQLSVQPPATPSPQPSPTPSPVTNLVGDINGDGKVSAIDIAILLSHWNQAVPVGTQGDLNKDGKVTAADIALLLAHYGN